MVDTGFNGALTLPPFLARELDLPWVSFGNATVGDGGESSFDVYEASVEWGDEERQALVDAVDIQPLVGMSLLYAQRLTITILPGGGVTIQDVDG